MHTLDIIGTRKKFGNKEAVAETNLHMEHGVYGLLGENGAGKTTLMRMICGILTPTKGEILCDNIPIDKLGGSYRKLLGYLPQDFGYYEDFTARRFLHYMGALKALSPKDAREKTDDLLELTGLKDNARQKLKTFSGGMLQRIGIAQALLNDPEILVLDEPTAGLDPKERVRFRNIISSLGKHRLVILSTHIVTDIDYIADQIFIMKNGKIIQNGTEEEMVCHIKNFVWKCVVSPKETERLSETYIVSNIRHQGELDELRIVSREKPVEQAALQEPALEDAYLFFTGEER